MTRMNWDRAAQQTAIRRYGVEHAGRPDTVASRADQRLADKILNPKSTSRNVTVQCRKCRHVGVLTVKAGENPQKFKCSKCGGRGQQYSKRLANMANFLEAIGKS